MTAFLALLLRGAVRVLTLLALIVLGLLALDWARGVWVGRAALLERLPALEAGAASARRDASAAAAELARLRRELDDTLARTTAGAADAASQLGAQHAAKLVELGRAQSAVTIATAAAASARRDADRARQALAFYERSELALLWSDATRAWQQKDLRARALESTASAARAAHERVQAESAALKARATHQQLLLEERLAAATRAQQPALAAAQSRVESSARAAERAGDALEQAQRRLAENRAEWLLDKVRAVLPRALWLLLLLLVVPVLWKALFYYGIAPWVSRRAPIRLAQGAVPAPVAGHSDATHAGRAVDGTDTDRAVDAIGARRAVDAAVAPSVGVLAASAVSIELDVAPHEQLLVKSAYLQSSSRDARKETVAVLSKRYWLSSFAAGMVLLTRLRPRAEAPTRVRVTATDDVLGELCVVLVPEGEGLVLRPSALAGAIHAHGHDVRIRSHWRLASLHAWCSWQLRFLEFRGACRLIVKGTRGVRVEVLTGTESRLVNGSATLGFGPGVPFRVTRTETFVPYLLGDEPLFNDLFGAGRGVIVYEERPSGRDGARIVRALTGWFDAFRQGLGI